MGVPQCLEAERFVIGSILNDWHGDNTNCGKALTYLSENDFFSPLYRRVFLTAAKLYNANIKADFVTILNELEGQTDFFDANNPAPVALSNILEGFPDVNDITHYIAVLKQKTADRRKIALGQKLASGNASSVEVQKEIDEIERMTAKEVEVNLSAIALEAMMELGKPDNYIPTGFESLNLLVKGWRPGNFTLLAGRPGTGKTTFALQSALHAVQNGKRAVFFSLEMTTLELYNKLWAYIANVNPKILQEPRPEEQKHLGTFADQLAALPLIIDDNVDKTVRAMTATIDKLMEKAPPDLVFIDNVQIISADRDIKKYESRNQELSEISRGLKKIAKRFNLPLVVISHLNRKIDERGKDAKPILSDLKESGSLEQDADNVIFLHRPDAYKNTNTHQDHGEIIASKVRMGTVGSALVTFDRKLGRFVE